MRTANKLPTQLLESILLSNYVKYERLREITYNEFKGSTAEDVNIYIDIYSIIERLFKSNYNITDYSLLTSFLINMAIHYKEFFRVNLHVNSKVYFVFSLNNCTLNTKLYKKYNYKKTFMISKNKLVSDMIEYNFKMMTLLCPYLKDIYFIHGTFETGVIINDIMCKNDIERCGVPNIVITKDLYNYQLCTMHPNTVILRPYKSFKDKETEDLSYYINYNNCLYKYIEDKKSANVNNFDLSLLSPALLTLFMTLTGVQERDIKLLMNAKSAYKIIVEKIQNEYFPNMHNASPEMIFKYFDGYININELDFCNRYNAIDIESQYRVYANTPEKNNIDSIVDLYNNQAILEINSKYFKNYPLDLERLIEIVKTK